MLGSHSHKALDWNGLSQEKIVDQFLKLTPETKLCNLLPEGRTILRDLNKAGVRQAAASGRRADSHGLRHTSAKRLDETGCSHATRRALMRHGAGDQTDGYTLARLSEMYEAVRRLPHPSDADVEIQVKTGTSDVPLLPDSVVTIGTPNVLTPNLTGTDAIGNRYAGKM